MTWKSFLSSIRSFICISLLPFRLKLANAATACDSVKELILKRGLQQQLKDFDNHLDDISNDWTNESLNQELAGLLA